MNRRSFLKAGASIAPAIILTPGLLMPVRNWWTPRTPRDFNDLIVSWNPAKGDLAHYEIWVARPNRAELLALVSRTTQNFAMLNMDKDKLRIEDRVLIRPVGMDGSVGKDNEATISMVDNNAMVTW